MKIRASPRSVAHRPPPNLRKQAAQLRIVITDHNRAVERNPVHEFQKSPLHLAHVAVAIHVLPVDVGDHRKHGRQFQERAVALIGLDYHVFRVAHAGIGAHGVHPPTDDDRGIKAPRSQHGGDHGGGRSLAVHPGNGDAVLQAHQLRQHLGARDDRDMESVGFGDLGILPDNRRTHHYDFRTSNIFRCVPFEDGGAQASQPLRDGGILQIRARNPVAKVDQHLGNAAHADAPDADEMNALDFGKHRSGKPSHGFTRINTD